MGVGGRGELAWRFSGFGEPKFPTELEDDAENDEMKLVCEKKKQQQQNKNKTKTKQIC